MDEILEKFDDKYAQVPNASFAELMKDMRDELIKKSFVDRDIDAYMTNSANGYAGLRDCYVRWRNGRLF